MKVIPFRPHEIRRPVQLIDLRGSRTLDPLELEFRSSGHPLDLHEESSLTVVRGFGAITVIADNNSRDALSWDIELSQRIVQPSLIEPASRRSIRIKVRPQEIVTIRGERFFFSTVQQPHVDEDFLTMRVTRGVLLGIETTEGTHYLEAADSGLRMRFDEPPSWITVFEYIEDDRFGTLVAVPVYRYKAPRQLILGDVSDGDSSYGFGM